MQESACLGLVVAFGAVVGLLIHARSERPEITRAGSKRIHPLKGTPWVLVLHPMVLFIGFIAYQDGEELVSSGPAGLAVWGLLWPLVVEVASCGRPYRVARLLRHYLVYEPVLPFTAEYKQYRRQTRPLRATQRKFIALVMTVVVVGAFLPGSFAGA